MSVSIVRQTELLLHISLARSLTLPTHRHDNHRVWLRAHLERLSDVPRLTAGEPPGFDTLTLWFPRLVLTGWNVRRAAVCAHLRLQFLNLDHQTVAFRRHPLELGRERLTARAGRGCDGSTLSGHRSQGPLLSSHPGFMYLEDENPLPDVEMSGSLTWPRNFLSA